MATPIVSGVAALVCSVNPKLDPENVKKILCESATDLGTRGFDIWTGYGLVNAEQAVTMAIKAAEDDKGAGDSGDPGQFVAKYSLDRNNNLHLTITTPLQYINWWGYALDTNQYAMREYYGNSCYQRINQYEINLNLRDLERYTQYYLRLFFITDTGKTYSPTWKFRLVNQSRGAGGGSLDPDKKIKIKQIGGKEKCE